MLYPLSYEGGECAHRCAKYRIEPILWSPHGTTVLDSCVLRAVALRWTRWGGLGPLRWPAGPLRSGSGGYGERLSNALSVRDSRSS